MLDPECATVAGVTMPYALLYRHRDARKVKAVYKSRKNYIKPPLHPDSAAKSRCVSEDATWSLCQSGMFLNRPICVTALWRAPGPSRPECQYIPMMSSSVIEAGVRARDPGRRYGGAN